MKISEIEAELNKQASMNEATQNLLKALLEEQKKTNELLQKQQEEIREMQRIQEALIHKDYEATAQLINGMGAKNSALYAFDKDSDKFCKMEGRGELRSPVAMGNDKTFADLKEGYPVSSDNGGVLIPYMKNGELLGVVSANDVSNPQVFISKITEGRLGEAISKNIQEAAEDVAMANLERQREHLEQQRNAFEMLAMNDGLTELLNRNGYESYLKRTVLPILQNGGSVSLIMIDGDRFKDINDEYGHDTGDKVLQSIAKAMRESVRDSDCAARIGGDEFLIVGAMNEKAAYEVAERIRQKVADTLIGFKTKENGRTVEKQIMAAISTGAATVKATAEQRDMLSVDTISEFVETFRKQADNRLYQAKQGAGIDESGRPKGKNQTVADEVVMMENDAVRIANVRSLNPMNLDVLVNDPSPRVRAEVVKALRDSDLDKLVQDESYEVQMAIVQYGREKDLQLLLSKDYGTQYEEVWQAARKQLALLEVSKTVSDTGYHVMIDRRSSQLFVSDGEVNHGTFRDLQELAIAFGSSYDTAQALKDTLSELPVRSFEERQKTVWQNNPYLRADNYRPDDPKDAKLKNLYGAEDRRKSAERAKE